MVSEVLQGFWGGAWAPTWLRGWFMLEGEAAMRCVTRHLSSPLPLAPCLAGPALEVGAGLGSPHLPLSTLMPTGSHPLLPPSLGPALHTNQPARALTRASKEVLPCFLIEILV